MFRKLVTFHHAFAGAGVSAWLTKTEVSDFGERNETSFVQTSLDCVDGASETTSKVSLSDYDYEDWEAQVDDQLKITSNDDPFDGHQDRYVLKCASGRGADYQVVDCKSEDDCDSSLEKTCSAGLIVGWCECDTANNFVLNATNVCECDTGYVLSDDGSTCEQQNAYYYNGTQTEIVCPDDGVLELNGLGITEIFVSPCDSLTELYLKKNDLTAPPDVSALVNLQVLNLNNNALTAPPDVSALVNLEELKLVSNSLTESPDLRQNANLTEFNINNNDNLKTLPDISNNGVLTNFQAKVSRIFFFPTVPEVIRLQIADDSANGWKLPDAFTSDEGNERFWSGGTNENGIDGLFCADGEALQEVTASDGRDFAMCCDSGETGSVSIVDGIVSGQCA